MNPHFAGEVDFDNLPFLKNTYMRRFQYLAVIPAEKWIGGSSSGTLLSDLNHAGNKDTLPLS
jgi:hypothetical protein